MTVSALNYRGHDPEVRFRDTSEQIQQPTIEMESFNMAKIVFQDKLELIYWVLPFIIISYSAADAFLTRRMVLKQPKYPLVGSQVSLMPTLILNFLFLGKAVELLQNGYQNFKNSTFQLIRSHGQLTILPLSLLEELAALPVTISNPSAALEQDLMGRYTGINLILENRLHHTIVQRRLTPRLPLLIPRIEQAVVESVEECFPARDEWMECQPYHALGHVSARAAADAIVGPLFSDSKIWLDVAFNYTENLFRTVVMLRSLPTWMSGLVYPLLPSYWAGQKYMNMAKQLLRPRLQELIQKSDSREWEPHDNNADELNLLSWLSSMAKGRDREPDTISHVLVLVALASVHTTLLRMVNVLYDIIAAGPELLNELLKEINSVAEDGWDVNSYDKLHRLDSVLRESQRISPPTTLGMKRLFKKSHTFHDGTYIPAGTYAALPIYAIENDALHTSNPEAYDGLRSFRAREEFEKPNNDGTHADKLAAKEFEFSTPTRTALNFGYGKAACPGRFFASVVIKMVTVRLITQYEFKFLPETGRPKNVMLHEFLFPWPWQRILVRRRKEGQCPF